MQPHRLEEPPQSRVAAVPERSSSSVAPARYLSSHNKSMVKKASERIPGLIPFT